MQHPRIVVSSRRQRAAHGSVQPGASGATGRALRPRRDPEESTVHEFETELAGVHALDTIQFSPQLGIQSGRSMGPRGGARPLVAKFAKRRADALFDVSRTDEEWSYSATGMVYKNDYQRCRCTPH